jgi:Tfp pilus assembly protein PilF
MAEIPFAGGISAEGVIVSNREPSQARRTVDEWRLEAETLENAGRLDEAENILGQILQQMPNYFPALHQAAILSYKRKRPGEALARLERVIELAPDQALYHRNICELYRSQKRLDEAVRHGKRAVELAPDDPGANYNLCVIHYDRLEMDEAIRYARRALALDPSMATAHFELAEGLLLTGQFKEGWEQYEWRFDLPNASPLMPSKIKPLWDGTPMPDKTLLLIGDQGFGDTIQFCRYLPQVLARCPNIIMACSSEMRPVLIQQPGIAGYFDRWEQVPAYDAYCSLSGLPRVFETDHGNIPAPIPYVRSDPAKSAQWGERIAKLSPGGYRRIGLVWAGRPAHGNDFNRSMPLTTLAPLFKREGIVLLSLQMGAAQAEIGRYFGAAPLVNLGAEIQDFTDTMGIMDHLDRLVCVDTGVAHLAGAMGRPVSIMLPFAPDWRWLLKRTDTPWYPNTTLCRQASSGHWPSAIEAMLATLDQKAI